MGKLEASYTDIVGCTAHFPRSLIRSLVITTSSSSGLKGGSEVSSPSEPWSDGGFGLRDFLTVRSLVPSK